MRERFAALNLPPVEQRAKFVRWIAYFFNTSSNHELRRALELPIKESTLEPLSLMCFFKFFSEQDPEIWKQLYVIKSLIRKMIEQGFLEHYGGGDMHARYFYSKEVTKLEAQGDLFLGSILGPEFLAHRMEGVVAHITGLTKDGDCAGGTGILLSETVVLTCAHVVDDMPNGKSVRIAGTEFSVQSVVSDPQVDVALVYLNGKAPSIRRDLAFRASRILEPIIIGGYPRIPFAAIPALTFQGGEIVALDVPTTHGQSIDLFSAIARPGNSGGPLVGRDGRIVGIVTQSLEEQFSQQKVEGDKVTSEVKTSFPFFAAVPADVIRESVRSLSGGKIELPYEDYQ